LSCTQAVLVEEAIEAGEFEGAGELGCPSEVVVAI
jgi:hypothetical protein